MVLVVRRRVSSRRARKRLASWLCRNEPGVKVRSCIALLLLAQVGASHAGELCANDERNTEPDMRIEESDLTRDAATSAALELHRLIERSELGGEVQMGVGNRLKIIKGYVLLQQARADEANALADPTGAEESRAIFCNWLVKDGAWYD